MPDTGPMTGEELRILHARMLLDRLTTIADSMEAIAEHLLTQNRTLNTIAEQLQQH